MAYRYNSSFFAIHPFSAAWTVQTKKKNKNDNPNSIVQSDRKTYIVIQRIFINADIFRFSKKIICWIFKFPSTNIYINGQEI